MSFRSTAWIAVVSLTAAIGLATPTPPGSAGSAGSAGPATARVEAAVAHLVRTSEALGDRRTLERFGPFVISATGTLDKTAEGQGFEPDAPSPGPYREVLVFDPAGGRVARDYREERYDGTFEAFREAYLGPSERLYVVHEPPLAIPFRSADFSEERRGLMRRLPHLLVAEMLERAAQTRLLAETAEVIVVLGALSDGTVVELEIDPRTALPSRVRYVAHLAAKGDTEVLWWFEEYRPVEGLGRVPFRYGATVGGTPYVDLTVDTVEPGGLEWFEAPEGYRRIPEQVVETEEEPDELDLEEIFPGVYRVPGVRSGFAPLVVVFEEFVVAVDAPASFPLLGRIPATETDPAPTMSWHSERFVDAIAAAFPERPLRYLVLTHAHEDHLGGVRAFVAAGATVMGPPAARPVVERLVALPPERTGDRLARTPAAALRFEAVTEPLSLADDAQRLDILPIGENPHAEGMLVVHLPAHRALFASDLVTPEPLAVYPRPSHAALDRFFAEWVERAGLDIERVLAMHGAPEATSEHLEAARRASRAEPAE
ncbi:MAG: MBL fold metallo-hydrolase [Thermoanaerobaculia bacterium]|nr:MBL fold metallo-hydrolase [Thermoanaerobaculia bacterium]